MPDETRPEICTCGWPRLPCQAWLICAADEFGFVDTTDEEASQ